MYSVKGLNVEQYEGETISGHNCDFVYTEVTLKRYRLFAQNETGAWVSISLYESYGECGSGWTTASFGHCDISTLSVAPDMDHIVDPSYDVEDTMFDISALSETSTDEYYTGIEFSHDIFDYSDVGGCGYYPSGSVGINMSYFIKKAEYLKEVKGIVCDEIGMIDELSTLIANLVV